jgi:hypothetical protein
VVKRSLFGAFVFLGACRAAQGNDDSASGAGGEPAASGGAGVAGIAMDGGRANTGGTSEGGIGDGGSDGGATSTGGRSGGASGSVGSGGAGTGGVGTGGTPSGGGTGGRTCPPPPVDSCDEQRCPSALPAEATTCAPDANACGCEGFACSDPGARCFRVARLAPIGTGGPGTIENRCYTNACVSDDDCSGGQRCFRDQYGIPVCAFACRYDSECTVDCGGRCLPSRVEGHAASYQDDYSNGRCLYEGACGSNSCPNCSNGGPGGSSSIYTGLHGCPG